jgi:pimeloyl-ACP methyl ester carboxylesterase
MNSNVSRVESRIRIGGGEIFVQTLIPPELTDDTVLIFLHDSLGSVQQWKSFPERIALALGLKAVLYDRLGHGQSDPFLMKRDTQYQHVEAYIFTRHLIESMRIGKALLIGHSDGASISLLYAGRFKEVAGVVAIAPHVFVEDITLAGIRDFKKVYDEKGLESSLERFHGAKTRQLFDAWHDTWLSSGFRHWSITEEVANITAPVLLVQGEKDEYGTLQQLDAICDRLKGSVTASVEKCIIPDCGHFPHISHRKPVESAIVDFVNKSVRRDLLKSR